MTDLFTILVLTSAWTYTITPDSSIVPYHIFAMPISLCIFLTFPHWLQCCSEELSAETAQMNTLEGSDVQDIALLTAYIPPASWHNGPLWIYMCPSGGYTTYEDSYFSSINTPLCGTACTTSVAHRVLQISNIAPILCHAVSSNTRAFVHKYLV
jgi:hypothetical protein